MPDKEALQARVNQLKEYCKTRFSEAENPRADKELRSLRKRLKRVQRKFRRAKAAEQKGQQKDKATESGG